MIEPSLWEQLTLLSSKLEGKPSISSLVRIAINNYLKQLDLSQDGGSNILSIQTGEQIDTKISFYQPNNSEISIYKAKRESKKRDLEIIEQKWDNLEKRGYSIDTKLKDLEVERVNTRKHFEMWLLDDASYEGKERIMLKKRHSEQELDKRESILFQERDTLPGGKDQLSKEQENIEIELVNYKEKISGLENP